jgi:dTDP-4-amino-4,6-dideoxygalactose transaminase
MIPYSKHYIDKKDIDAAADVLRNKNIAQGELIDYLERKNSSNHLYVVRIKYKRIKKTRNMIMNYLKSKGIITQVHYIPITNHPLFKKYINKNDKLENTIS